MRHEDLKKLIDGTSDAAYVINNQGLIVAWNAAAHRLFGVTAEKAIGRSCRTVVQGVDEFGAVCSTNCTVQQALDKRRPMESFDLQVQTVDGQKWCNVSVLIAETTSSIQSYAIHIVRPVDLRKRLEIAVRDVIVSNTGMSADQARVMVASRPAAKVIELSAREIEVLGFLAKGRTTKGIATELHISRSTVNNHIQHILHKLDSHTRLQAIRRAENARLI
jgi:PAS domain S-box-containing protein